MNSDSSFQLGFNEDDRAQRLFLEFDQLCGQINLSHRHKIQIDYWFCVKGSFKVGLAEEVDGKTVVRWEYLSDKNPRIIKIEPGIWHGYKALQPESIMMYYLTEKYDSSDEWKVKPGHFGENWEIESK